METTIAPPPAVPPVSMTSSARSRYITLTIVVVLAAIAVGGYWFMRSSYGAFYGVRYLSGTFDSRTLNEFGIKGIHTVSVPVPGRMYDYARGGHTEAALAVLPSGTQDAYLIQSGKATALTSDGRVKSSIAVSADGSMIAYALHTHEATSTLAVDFFAPKDWTIELIKKDGTDPKTIDIGYGPQFFTMGGHEHLLYTTERGIQLVDLVTNTHQDIHVSFGVKTSIHVAAVSPDGEYVALPDVGSGYALYSLVYTDGLARLNPVGALPEVTGAVTFKGSTLLSATVTKSNALFRISEPANPSIITRARTQSVTSVFKLIP
ncbi:MAG: hypothetical protein JWN90_512 [Parcubacteria group bacterium]|nr:hypothetical protein [Parcubacteria group bacterium]